MGRALALVVGNRRIRMGLCKEIRKRRTATARESYAAVVASYASLLDIIDLDHAQHTRHNGLARQSRNIHPQIRTSIPRPLPRRPRFLRTVHRRGVLYWRERCDDVGWNCCFGVGQ